MPELLDPGMLDRLSGRAHTVAHDYPRGHALLEDLSPDAIGPAIPNGGRLLAAILDAAGPAAELGHHGPPHWTRVAAYGLDVHPEADLTVVLLFALLHDAQRRSNQAWLSGKPGPARRGGGNLQSPSVSGARTTADRGVGAKLAVAGWRFQHHRIFSRQPQAKGGVLLGRFERRSHP